MLNWLPSLLLYPSMDRNERTAPNTSTDSSFYFYFYFLPPLCSSVFSPLFCIIVGFIFISLLLSFFSFVSPPRSQPTRRSQLVDRKCLSLSFSVCSRSSLNPTCPTDIVSTSSDAVPRPAKKRQTTLKGETQKQTKNKIEKSIRIVFIFYFFSSIRWLQQVISSTTAIFFFVIFNRYTQYAFGYYKSLTHYRHRNSYILQKHRTRSLLCFSLLLKLDMTHVTDAVTLFTTRRSAGVERSSRQQGDK